MTDLYLDPTTGDLDITNGVKLVPTYEEEARQRLEQYLAVNLAEWFADINAGLPYLRNPNESLETNIRYFLGNKFPDTPRYITETVVDYVEGLPFIRSATGTYDFNNRTRVYTLALEAVLDNGTTITFPDIFTTTLV